MGIPNAICATKFKSFEKCQYNSIFLTPIGFETRGSTKSSEKSTTLQKKKPLANQEIPAIRIGRLENQLLGRGLRSVTIFLLEKTRQSTRSGGTGASCVRPWLTRVFVKTGSFRRG